MLNCSPLIIKYEKTDFPTSNILYWNNFSLQSAFCRWISFWNLHLPQTCVLRFNASKIRSISVAQSNLTGFAPVLEVFFEFPKVQPIPATSLTRCVDIFPFLHSLPRSNWNKTHFPVIFVSIVSLDSIHELISVRLKILFKLGAVFVILILRYICRSSSTSTIFTPIWFCYNMH